MVPAQGVMFGLIGAGYCGHWLVNAVRKDYFRASRLRGRRYVYRRDRPGMYWANVAVMTALCALSLAIVVWAVLSPGSFH
jgi:hypothetical protein